MDAYTIVKLAVEGVLRGDVSPEKLVAIVQNNRVQFELVFGELEGAICLRAINTESAGIQVIDALRRLQGNSKFIRYRFVDLRKHAPALDEFIIEKLETDATEFMMEDLEVLEREFGGFHHRLNVIHKAKASLISAYADQIDKQPVELSNDIRRVSHWILEYGFNPELNEILQKIEDNLVLPQDKFEHKAAINNLRSFYEKLHEECAKLLCRHEPAVADKTALGNCPKAIEFLERNDVLTREMVLFAKGLWSILSDKGAHALSAEKEYVRLCRNVAAEYALILFFEMRRRLKA